MLTNGVSETAGPSRTAMMTAGARGWHLFSHGPRDRPQTRARRAGDPSGQVSTWVAARSRIGEDWPAASGAEHYVILGAGLDSFAWRQQRGVRVSEVDQPTTQAWKRARLEALGIPLPPELVWVPLDFEVESVAAGFEGVGLSSGPAFISWLGVIHYLSPEAIAATLRELPPCSLAVTYITPEDTWQGDVATASKKFQAMALQAGEPLMSMLTPNEMADVLTDAGFAVVEDVGPEDVEARYGLPALSIANERIALATKDA